MPDHRSLVATIRKAFVDRPGLEVSFEEACRHWPANEEQCAVALDVLAAERFLVRLDDGSYRQAAISQTDPTPLPDATLRLNSTWRIVSFDLGAASLLRRESAALYGAHISGLLPGSGLGTAADAELKQRGCIRRVVHLPNHSATLDVVACRSDNAIVVNLKDSSFDALTARVHGLATRLRLAAGVAELGFWEWDIQNDRVKWDGTKYRGAPGTVEDGVSIETFYDMVHSEDRGAVRRAIDDAVQLGTPYRIRFRFIWPGGTVRWVAATGVVETAESGHAVSFVGVSHDITERVQVEEERNTLAASVQRKDDMVAVVSNELRQPLGALHEALQLMEQRQDGAIGERARRTIDREVRHLSRIVDDLDEAAALQRGTTRLEPRRLDLNDVLRAAIEPFRSQALRRGLAMASQLHDDPVWITGDPARLQQVFSNLLNNAIKYTKPGGRADVTWLVDGSDAVVSVRDSGVGLEPDALEWIFEPFTRAPTTAGGLGIGLMVARSLVELHGGSVSARSAGPGRGSEFIVRLPLAPVPADRVEG